MMRIKKIKEKEIAMVRAQADPCKYAGHQGAWDCLYDCTSNSQPRWYGGKEY